MLCNKLEGKVIAALITLKVIKNMKDKMPVYKKPVAVIPGF
jgi:hypothetical protein